MYIHLKSLLGALAFSLLFYSKSFGLNVFLISIIVLVFLSTLYRERPFPRVYALSYLLTAAMVFIAPTGFQLFVHFVALLVLVGKSMTSKSSLHIAGFAGLINLFTGMLVHWVEQQNLPKEARKNISPQLLNYLKGGTISLLLLVFFTVLYQNANPVFGQLIAGIDLSFISVPWLFFTGAGYLLFLNILRPFHPKELMDFDAARGNALVPPSEPFSRIDLYKLEREHTLGSMVFAALNLLLILFLITDMIYLLNPDITSNADYSNSVHQGVYALMFSIVVAIAIILYFFRGDLNFYHNNKRLKALSYSWIALNLVLVVFTFYKNWAYVEALGLTYKRIGVFVYLLLTLTGLATAYIKVSQLKNFTYLLRTHMALLFLFLVVSSTVPWDRAITWYNLGHIRHPDIAYLLDLGDGNLQQLHEYAHTKDNTLIWEQERTINDRYREFLEAQAEKTWQEYTFYQLTQNFRE